MCNLLSCLFKFYIYGNQTTNGPQDPLIAAQNLVALKVIPFRLHHRWNLEVSF